MTTLDTVLSFLQGKGLSSAQAAGVAGNWTVESGLNPAAHNDREGAIGLAQWEGGRRKALDSFASKTGSNETDLNTQLNFAWSELQGSESGALQRLLATNDPGAAAAAVDQYYERSSGAARATRVADAQAIAAGRPTTTGGGPSSSTGQPMGFWSSLNPANWVTGVYGIALKTAGAAVAGALVVTGVKETMKGTSS